MADKPLSILKREAVQQEQVNSGHFLELMDRLHVVICIADVISINDMKGAA